MVTSCRFCSFRIMVTIIFLIKTSEKVNFHKNVPIVAFCLGTASSPLGRGRSVHESDGPLISIDMKSVNQFLRFIFLTYFLQIG